nr:ribonuclease H-like domain-containing protein [Tanacetum cinerariifolium]
MLLVKNLVLPSKVDAVDDYSRFTWVFFLATKDETSPILKTFIIVLENQLSLKNGVLVTKPHNNTHYELLHGRSPSIGFMRPFGCPVTILNTLDSLGKYERKFDEGFLIGYSVNSKAFRVFNNRTRIVQETLHVNFLKNKPNVAGSGPIWLFDIDSLIRTMNYQPLTAGNQTNSSAGFQDIFDAEKAGEEIDQQYVLFLVWSSGFTNPQNNDGNAAFDGKEHDFDVKKPKSEVSVSPSSSAQSRKQDDKTKKEAKGKSHGNPQHALEDKGVIVSGCSRDMTGNMSYLSDFEELNRGYVAFGGNPKGGKIFGKGKIKTGKLDFDDVYFIKELKFNLFSVSQICDKKNSVLFTDTESLVLSPDFKLPNESYVLLRVPRENNMYNVNLKNIVPSGDLTCLFAKETID